MGIRLSPGQEACVRLAGEGLRSKVIAGTLGISVRTVENHLHAANKILGTDNRKDAYRELLKDYSEQSMSVAEPVDSALDQGVFRTGAVSSEEGDKQGWERIYSAYARLGPLRTPPRSTEARVAFILIWTIIGLLMFSVVAGAVTLIISTDRIAEAAYETPEGQA